MRPALLFLAAYIATFFILVYLHATYGSLLNDAVLTIWPVLFMFLVMYGVPALVAAVAVSIRGLTPKARLLLGSGYLAALVVFFEVVHNSEVVLPFVIRDLLSGFGAVAFVLATFVLCSSFVRLALKTARSAV